MLAIKRFYIRIAQRAMRNPLLDCMRLLLCPFSFIYGVLINIRNALFDKKYIRSYASSSKVISVGNIVWGGTAKTSLVIRLAEHFLKKAPTAVVYRGYSKDEPSLVKNTTRGSVGVFSGKDRVSLIKRIQENFTYIILDDGFQYRYLGRDANIVLFNATYSLRDYLIPSGIYRERLISIKRADCAVITSCDLVDERRLFFMKDRLRSLNPQMPIFCANYKIDNFYSGGVPLDKDLLKNRNTGLLASIASPISFKEKVLKEGLSIKRELIYPDHHKFSKTDIKYINNQIKKDELGYIITTEKDYERLKEHRLSAGVVVTNARLVIEQESKFFDFIDSLMMNKK